ncbi:MAG: TlpA family protein disulfide reductase [Gemmatimonadaceae bacterium]
MTGIKRLGTLVVASAVAAAGTAAVRASAPRSVQRAPSAVGDTLPWLTMRTPAGNAVSLHDRIHGHPVLIYVVNEAECASCSNLPLEFRILRREAPGVEALLVGSGSSPTSFTPLLERMDLASSALIDESQGLLRALRLSAEPVTVLIDSSGRVLFEDLRSTSKAAQFPMGRVLHDLTAVLARRGDSVWLHDRK